MRNDTDNNSNDSSLHHQGHDENEYSGLIHQAIQQHPPRSPRGVSLKEGTGTNIVDSAVACSSSSPLSSTTPIQKQLCLSTELATASVYAATPVDASLGPATTSTSSGGNKPALIDNNINNQIETPHLTRNVSASSPRSPTNNNIINNNHNKGNLTTLMTVTNSSALEGESNRIAALTPRKRDDNSLSSFSRERKEDDPSQVLLVSESMSSAALPPTIRSNKPASESGRSRGATPPRPTRNTNRDVGIPGSSSAEGQQLSMTQQPTQQRRSSRRSASPNRIPRIPNKQMSAPVLGDGNASQNSSPRRFSKDQHSLASSGGGSLSLSRRSSYRSNNQWQWAPPKSDPADYEQNLFEQRLCEDSHGVAVRKINQNGKPNLRYVRCLVVDSDADTIGTMGDSQNQVTSTRSSVSSLARSFRKAGSSLSAATPPQTQETNNNNTSAKVRVLTWGKKKDVRLPLDRFVCVRKGKTTERARRNTSPSSRVLSLITNDPNHPSLDIEAPTRLDRDKFARAFARFLEVPLMGEDQTAQSVSPRPEQLSSYRKSSAKTAFSEPDMATTPKQTIEEAKRLKQLQYTSSSQHNAPLPVIMAGNDKSSKTENIKNVIDGQMTRKDHPSLRTSTTSASPNNSSAIDNSSHSNPPKTYHENQQVQIASLPASLRGSERSSTQAATASRPTQPDHQPHNADDASQVSSLTGAGFDQEIVEELHQALTELKAELEESRAEAARAVKVAEQAIQSAENSNSNDWNSTVTHKAAEAAALAQKKSAEAMAKQRLAEERLEGEQRTALFWRRQAEAAEEEAGTLQTRAAAAEVQRAAMAEELECERRKTTAMMDALKIRYSSAEKHQREALEAALERNRTLELELDGTRRDLVVKNDEANTLEETLSFSNNSEAHKSVSRKKLGIIGRKKKTHDASDMSASMKLLVGSGRSSSSPETVALRESGLVNNNVIPEKILKLHAEASDVRKHFEMFRRAAADELRRLPEDAKLWSDQVSQTMRDAQSEISLLREKLALESAARRKLLNDVQDLRGVVRVYCRPRSSPPGVNGILSIPSQETLLLQPYEKESPVSFKFDRVFTPDVEQREIYNEIEELCLSVMDGYNICLLAHGQSGTGKTYSLLGNVVYSHDETNHAVKVGIEDHGIHLKTAQQLFSIAEHRKERYQDVFSLEIVEVYNERLHDLLAGTDIGETRGQLVMDDAKVHPKRSFRRGGISEDGSCTTGPLHLSNSHSVSSKQGSTMTKLEIRTNHNGDTVVQGSISVEVSTFEEVYEIWQQCLSQRASRLVEQGLDIAEYEASSHVIATLTVVSTNAATGMGSTGKIKFVDLAGADLVHKRPTNSDAIKSGPSEPSPDWKYSNRSLATLNDVVNCRSQYMRSVPYRNSTLTHLLRDNLEADTKVMLLLCLSAHPNDLEETACALRFASGMRRVTIGKATKHMICRP